MVSTSTLGSPVRIPVLPVLTGGGNNLIADVEWATSPFRPSSPSGLIELHHCRWVREIDVFSRPATPDLPYAPPN
jgi:hypothetical protein